MNLIDASFNPKIQRFPLAVLVATGLLLAGLGCKPSEHPAPVVVSVAAATVSQQPITSHITADAVLFPVPQAAIAPRVTAPVRRFLVARGSKVRAGQLLAQLENRDLAAAAMDNRGSYNQALANYETTTKAQVPEDLRKAQLDLDQARVNLDVSQKAFDSRQSLFSQGAIPGRDLDTAKASLVQSKATFDLAQQHLHSVENISHEAALKGAQGQLDSAAGKYHGAEAQLGYSDIRSPINGVVTDRPLYAGETAAAGTPLLTVMDTSALLAKLHLPQVQAQQLKIGAPAEVKVGGIEAPVQGKVTLVSPALDPGSTTVEVWVRVENPDAALKAGTGVHVSITANTVADALVVPSQAVLTDSTGKTTVMVIGSDQVAHQREVETGVADNGLTQISSGLKAGEKVVTTGAYAMDDGTHVKILSAAELENGGDKTGKAGAAD